MKIVFLIPPSEAKLSSSFYKKEELSFVFKKPFSIIKNVNEKDLKCTWKRFEEALILNKNIEKWNNLEVIKRYDWVMYKAIDYDNLNYDWKLYFNDNFLILSGMYGILRPLDKIWNYKLPIESKNLSKFWKTKIAYELNKIDCDYIVDLLPDSYKKMISFKEIDTTIIRINFIKNNGKKVSHWVKKIKWEWIKAICEKWVNDYENFWRLDYYSEKLINVFVNC